MANILHKDLCYQLYGLLFNVHNSLGGFCKHNQYCEALEVLLKENGIKYKREIEVPIKFNKIRLAGNILDFLIDDKIVLDIKCKRYITKQDYVQMKRYLRATENELGIIVNFSEKKIKPVRILDKKHSDNIRK
ncbi:MAG: GxxExxY protein [Candidatus Moranbacteria bacterium]|nr:GxxExxY protein [Candidatus Moranbacteria bacterium]